MHRLVALALFSVGCSEYKLTDGAGFSEDIVTEGVDTGIGSDDHDEATGSSGPGGFDPFGSDDPTVGVPWNGDDPNGSDDPSSDDPDGDDPEDPSDSDDPDGDDPEDPSGDDPSDDGDGPSPWDDPWADDTPDDHDTGCSGTIGYWSNHEWDASLVLGNVTYDEAGLREILDTPVRGDISVQLGRQLIGVKLAILFGADDSQIWKTVDDADRWLIANDDGDGIPLDISSSTDQGAIGNELTEALTDYNEGRAGPDHC